ncbi:hypothetical protein ACJW31_09G095900 [Castanea mollissima]
MDSFTINKKLLVSLLFFVQFIIVITPGSHSELMPVETSTETLWPIGPIKYLTKFEAVANSQSHEDALRRRLAPAPFQTCNQCTCCSGPNNQTCTTKPCCYGIKCNIPGKPFGTCAFVPKKCDCNPCN